MPAGAPPHGFTYDKRAGNYVVDEASMITVRRIFGLVAGGYSLHKVRRTFESEGLRTVDNPRMP